MKKLKQQGFTLIEMIVVLTIIAIISVMGMAAFSNYNHVQLLNSSAMDVITMLNTARSRSLSQVIPSKCSDKVFEGYQVMICDRTNCEDDTANFELQVVCGGESYLISSKKLPQNIAISDESMGKAFLFHALTGLVSVVQNTGPASNKIIVNGYGETRTITTDNLGNIKVEPKI